MAAPRLKLASFGNLRGRTRGKFVIATIARAIMNSSSRKIKELENSHLQYVEDAWITFSNVLPVRSVDNREAASVDVILGATLGARGLCPASICSTDRVCSLPVRYVTAMSARL
jgi:hypothetical protein